MAYVSAVKEGRTGQQYVAVIAAAVVERGDKWVAQTGGEAGFDPGRRGQRGAERVRFYESSRFHLVLPQEEVREVYVSAEWWAAHVAPGVSWEEFVGIGCVMSWSLGVHLGLVP
jgi:hypothetical protein